MSQNFGSPNSIQPLSVGNVVTAAIRLYRSHFKQYISLSLQGILWMLIPIYGWAKASAINAMISRLAFGTLVNQPEPLQIIRSQLNPRMWVFFVAQILVWLISVSTNIGITIVQYIIVIPASLVLREQPALLGLISLIVQLISFIAYIWVYAHILIPELPIAIEDNIDSSQAISRSWELTNGNVWRLQLIILLASLITFPLFLLAFIPFFVGIISLIAATTAAASNPESISESALAAFSISMLISLVLFLLANLIANPFWQSMKAVIYYDFRTRREGLGLKLRDYEI